MWHRRSPVLRDFEAFAFRDVASRMSSLMVFPVISRFRAGIPWRDLPERFGSKGSPWSPPPVCSGPQCPPTPGASPCSPFPSWPTTSSRRRPGGCYRSRHDRRQASSCFHRGRRHHRRRCRICRMGFGTGRALDSPMNGLRREAAWRPTGDGSKSKLGVNP